MRPLGKAAQSAAPHLSAERVPSIGKLANTFDRRYRFEEERFAESGCLVVVIGKSLVELPPCDLEEADVHSTRYFASTSFNGTALISPRR